MTTQQAYARGHGAASVRPAITVRDSASDENTVDIRDSRPLGPPLSPLDQPQDDAQTQTADSKTASLESNAANLPPASSQVVVLRIGPDTRPRIVPQNPQDLSKGSAQNYHVVIDNVGGPPTHIVGSLQDMQEFLGNFGLEVANEAGIRHSVLDDAYGVEDDHRRRSLRIGMGF